MKGGGVRRNLERLDDLVKTLGRPASIQVGIFSNKTGRPSKFIDNAGLGAVHELGAPEHNVPPRSWLRMPIAEKRAQIMKEGMQGSLEMIAKGETAKVWKNLGLACERAVMAAFDTGGFGKWAPLQYATLLAKLKGSLTVRRQKAAETLLEGGHYASILIRTGQLRRAVASRVK